MSSFSVILEPKYFQLPSPPKSTYNTYNEPFKEKQRKRKKANNLDINWSEDGF